MKRLDSNTNSMDMSLDKLQETVEDKGAWWATVHGVTVLDFAKEQQQHRETATPLTVSRLCFN